MENNEVTNTDKEIISDMKKELALVDADNASSSAEGGLVEEDFISLESARLLMQFKDGIAIAIVAKDTSENATVLIAEALRTDEETTLLWRKLIQKYIRKHFPQLVEKIKNVTNDELSVLVVVETMKVANAWTIRIEDQGLKENKGMFTRFALWLKSLMPAKSPVVVPKAV